MRISVILLIVLSSCISDKAKDLDTVPSDQPVPEPQNTMQVDSVDTVQVDTVGELEMRLIDAGLVNIHDLDSSILVELKYSTTDNFLNQDVYGSLTNAYLQEDVAEKLAQAQLYLKEVDSTLSLLIYDAVRPRSVQQQMWDIVDMPLDQKVKFVSNPKYGSIHNFGAAVDITIADSNGIALDMGAGFDDPRVEAWPLKEQEMLNQGRISKVHIDNRKLLRSVMGRAGFFNIQSEWWHFNSCYRDEAYQKYSIVE